MITRRNFITGLLASVSGFLGAGAGWFGRKAVSSMATSVIYGTYTARIAYSATAGQWWFQTDVGMDGSTTYASGYYLFDNSEWGYFPLAGVAGNLGGVTFENGASPVLTLKRYTNNPGIARTTLYHSVGLNETGTAGSGADEGFVVQDSSSHVQILGGLGFIIDDDSGTNQNGIHHVRIRGAHNADQASADIIRVLNADLKSQYRWRGSITTGLFYGEAVKYIHYTNSTAVANTTNETTLLLAGDPLTFPADYFNDDTGVGIGRVMEIVAMGVFGTTATPTLRLRFFLGGSAIIDTTALTMPNTVTNVGWEYRALVTCQATGVSGTFRGQGRWNYHTSTAGAPSTAATTLDTTGTLAFDLMATWGTSNPSNTIQCTNAFVRVIA